MATTGSCFSRILAKFQPEQTLIDHIEDCLVVFERVRRERAGLIERLCRQASVDRETLVHNTSLALMLHDIGKMTSDFQRNGGTRRTFPHPLASLIFANEAFDGQTSLRVGGRDVHLELASIESHHSRLIQHKYAQYTNIDPPPVEPRCLEEARRYIERRYEELWGIPRSIPLSVGTKPDACVLKVEQSLAILRRTDSWRARTAFSLIKGLLNYCDWTASAGKSLSESITDIEDHVIQDLSTKKRFRGLNDFQSRSRNTVGSALLRAPTGTGKTEAALLWAHANHVGRVVYLLPTMTTSNSMFERMRRLWPTRAGLCHSTAPFILRSEAEEEDREDDREFAFEYLLDKTFMKPVVVATLDQLLYSFLNNGRWEVSWFNACAGGVILDEIHCYQPFTVGLAVECLSQLKATGAPVFLMSATLPTGLKDFLIETLDLPPHSVIEANEFASLRRHRIHVHADEGLEGFLKEVMNQFSEGRRVLVVCNTVSRARKIFKMLRGFGLDLNSVKLLHSQYLLRDRLQKEAELISEEDKPIRERRPVILVATQVVEVSLDIDFDVLFTEAAPLDALIQRMGRVNRRRNGGVSDVHICQPTRDSFLVYDRDIIEGTVDSLRGASDTPSARELMTLSEMVYPRERLLEALRKGLDDACRVLLNTRISLLGVLSLSGLEDVQGLTRPTDYPTVTVIPNKYRDEALQSKPWERLGFTVKAPVAVCKGLLDWNEDTWIPFAHLEYDTIEGLMRPNHPQDGIII